MFNRHQYIEKEHQKLGSENLSKFSLAHYRNFVVQNNLDYRYILSAMRTETQRIMTEKEHAKFSADNIKPNIEFCGKTPQHNSDCVEVVRTKHEKLATRGLAMCGLVWRCPICSLKIMNGKKDELNEMVKAHFSKGRKIGFLTLTIRHKKKDDLDDTLFKINDNYRRFQQTRQFREFKKKHLIGQVKALEITFTYQNGWNPHLHLLYFYNHSDEKQIEKEQKAIISKWAKFRNNNSLVRGQDQQVAYDNHIVEYEAKMDIINEITMSDLKKAKGFTPFQALRMIATKDYADNKKRQFLVSRFREYVNYTQGRHRLFISKGIKDEYRIIEKDDNHHLNNVDIEEVLLRFSHIIWLQLSTKKLAPHVLNLLDYGGQDTVFQFLESKGVKFDVKTDRDEINHII